MRRRLFFLLPNVKSARQTFDELLLARIEERHIHFLARDNIALGDLPQATLLQKSDTIHGLGVGLIVGGATGAVAGAVTLAFPPSGLAMGLGVVLTTSLIGALMGVWASGMIASDVPNTHLARFARDIEKGKILLMLDVPKEHVPEMVSLIRTHHPEADALGRDPTIPAFP